jgi:hypothetical protein
MRLLAVLGLAAASAWASVNAVLAGVAMTIFAQLRLQLGDDAGRGVAGRVFGAILEWWMVVVWVLAGVLAVTLVATLAVAWERGRRLGPALGALLLLALLGLHGYGHHLVGAVREAREALPAETDVREDALFQTLHQRSERIFGLETLLALTAAMVMGGACLRRRGRVDDDAG